MGKLNKVEAVLEETLRGKGNITSKYRLSAEEALDAANKFLGSVYRGLGKYGQGVFRSKDGLRQFRMGSGSLLGNHLLVLLMFIWNDLNLV